MDSYDTPFEGSTVGEVLLTPTKIYIKPVLEVIKNVDVHAICHITGGGFDENIPRVVHDDQGILIHEGTWPILPIFKYLEKTGNIPHREMFNVFNMGIGMMIIVKPNDADKVISILESKGEKAYKIGEITNQKGVVIK